MFADDLRALRARAGMTIAELAAHSHTSRAAITDYEAGRKQPRFDTADRVLRALGHTIAIANTPREPAQWQPPLDPAAVQAIEQARMTPAEAITEARASSAEILEQYANAERLGLTWGDITTIIDGWTIAGDPLNVHRARTIAQSIKAAIKAARSEPTALQDVVGGVAISENRELQLLTRALDWYARVIAAGGDATLAASTMNGSLVAAGYPWIYPAFHRVDDYRKALVVCATSGNARPLTSVLAASITERRFTA